MPKQANSTVPYNSGETIARYGGGDRGVRVGEVSNPCSLGEAPRRIFVPLLAGLHGQRSKTRSPLCLPTLPPSSSGPLRALRG